MTAVRHYRQWTKAEDVMLKRLYKTEGPEVVAAKLGRSLSSVRNRAKAFRLRREHYWWTPEEDAKLRELWGKATALELMAAFRRSSVAIKKRANDLGLDKRVLWTDEEKELVRRLHATHTARQIAAALGLPDTFESRKAVNALRSRMRAGPAPLPAKVAPWPAEVIERLTALHAEGLLDWQIAARMADVFHAGDRGRLQATMLRKRLGLPRNDDAVHRARQAAGLKSMTRYGGGEMKAQAYRAFARENGWPEDLRVREVQILNALAAEGPMTAADLHARIGMPAPKRYKGRPIYLPGNGKGGTYTANLIERGLIVHLSRRPRAGLYMLSEAAARMVEERASTGVRGCSTHSQAVAASCGENEVA